MADSQSCPDVLWEAVKNGHEVHVSVALQKLAKDVNNKSAEFPPRGEWGTPLRRSCSEDGRRWCRTSNKDAVRAPAQVWRNNANILDKLLEAGADPNTKDGESGWTPLHRAVYFGNLSLAAPLLLADASTDIQDHKGRTPLDLLTKELKNCAPPTAPASAPDHQRTSGTPSPGSSYQQHGISSCQVSIHAASSAAQPGSALYSWGCGANYQLGTGSMDFHESPVRIDAAGEQGMGPVAALAAGKYHSAALDASGKLYTGDSAVIHPLLVSGLGKRQVVAVAAAKHHMLACTSSGELFSWGSNRDGKLGYAGVNSQPTPKKIAALRQRVVAVAAANRHSACITSAGEVYTWGANEDGQLGYGTSDSCSNSTPRLVDPLKGKNVVAISASKRHTVVLTSEGEPYTWGHTVVTPRRVQLAGSRDISRSSGAGNSSGGMGGSTALGTASGSSTGVEATGPTTSLELSFHRGHNLVARPFALEVAAGYTHSSVITRGGTVLLWYSADPLLKVQEVAGPMGGKRVVCLSAGKYRTMASTDLGNVYFWETINRGVQPGRKSSTQSEFKPGSIPQQQVCLGDKHSLATVCWTVPTIPGLNAFENYAAGKAKPIVITHKDHGMIVDDDEDDLQLEEDASSAHGLPWLDHEGGLGQEKKESGPVKSLQVICQRAVAVELVEPRTALQILEYADIANAHLLRIFCISLALQNLDMVLMEARYAFEGLPPHLLAEMELQYKRWLAPLPLQGGTADADMLGVEGGEGGLRRPRLSVSGSSPPLGSSPIMGSWAEQMMLLRIERFPAVDAEGPPLC
eukprot:gene29260-12503_t